jgi:phosphoribosylglycinamide formyltransferase-1
MSGVAPLRLAVLISGNGSNLQAIIDAIAAGTLNATIVCVVSNNPDAYGLERAQQANIPTHVLNHRNYKQREDYDAALQSLLEPFQPHLIILAGFMRILSPGFVATYAGRILNIHPSLLPKYPGLNTHEQVLANGDKEHGCTVHLVTADLDQGPIIKQARLTVLTSDTLESLKQRVHSLEHTLYPQAIQQFSDQLITK